MGSSARFHATGALGGSFVHLTAARSTQLGRDELSSLGVLGALRRCFSDVTMIHGLDE